MLLYYLTHRECHVLSSYVSVVPTLVSSGRLCCGRYAPLSSDGRSLDHCAVLNKGTDEELTARGFCRSLVRSALCWLATALLALAPLLLAHWRPDWRLRLTHRRCALRDATAVRLKVRPARQPAGWDVRVATGRGEPWGRVQ